ncbi:MAG TPA: stalk domain-containing protein [Clostridia bacterium]|nr:stalk domain-containing protein [Clostridia bacterium]
MKNAGRIFILAVILVSCLLMFTFAVDVAKKVQAVESNTRIIYNSKEVSLGEKPFTIEGSNYLPINALAELFSKNIYWNHNQQKVFISDKPDTALESLKTELAAKNKTISELQENVKQLEKGIIAGKKKSIKELQDMINNKSGRYEDVPYRVILSGHEDEVRVKIEVDLSYDKDAWDQLNSSDKKDMAKEISNAVSGEYGYARITGYIKDISTSKRLVVFYNNYEGEIELGVYKNYNTISTLEDRFNEEYDDYFKRVHLTYTFKGNENRIEFNAFIQKSKFEEEWKKISDSSLNGFMKKLCREIQKDELKKCLVAGYIYDTDSGRQLAFCEQSPDKNFIFRREQQP